MKTHKDLIVWQKSMDLVVEIYKLVKLLPKEKVYVLSDQMRRSAVSIPSNIAEGYGRSSTREYIRFLKIARGSCFELDTQINTCVCIGYLKESSVGFSFDLLNKIMKMLNSLVIKLNDRMEPN